MSSIQTVLFDLDGTLLDTAPDLAYALNVLRRAHELPDLPLQTIKPSVGNGSKTMLKLAFDIDETNANYSILLEAFLNTYDTCLARETALFPGMEEVLTFLDKKAIPWGIVTNKPARFTRVILDTLNLTRRAKCIISGDSLNERKPHPAPILHACKLLDANPATTIYVGDAQTDIMASKAAGTRGIAALYGYISADEDPYSWQADAYIKSPLEIMPMVQ